MKRSLYLIVGIAAAAAGTNVSTFAQAPGAQVPDRYIVEVRAGAGARGVATRHGLQPDFVYDKAVNGFAGFVPPGQLQRLQADPQVVSITPDRVVQAIGKGGKPGGDGGSTPPPPQVVPEGVKRIGAAPGILGVTGAGVGVAIVDTGLDLNHADLTISSHSFYAYGKSAADENGHGTHVGGTVAAKNNDIDVVGVAPGATLYAVRVLNRQGSGTDSSIIAGLNWIAENSEADPSAPIRVANISLGRPGSADDNPTMRAAVQTLVANGITVVVAAGNDCNLEVWQQVPASYPEVISVASTTARDGENPYFSVIAWDPVADTASYFTTDGAVTISAPGEEAENVVRNVFGYAVESIGILSTKRGGGTTRMSGTSMAAPHVAGVAALLVQQGTAGGPDGIRNRITGGADNPSAPYANGVDCYSADGVNEGILHAGNALTAAP